MASQIWLDAFVSIAAKDLSSFVKSATLNYSAEMVDETTMGNTTRINKGGLKNWSIDVEFKQDFGATPAPDIDLFSLVGTACALLVRPVKSTVVGPTNPNYTGSGVLETYNPVEGSVGDLASATVTFQSAGTLTRAVA